MYLVDLKFNLLVAEIVACEYSRLSFAEQLRGGCIRRPLWSVNIRCLFVIFTIVTIVTTVTFSLLSLLSVISFLDFFHYTLLGICISPTHSTSLGLLENSCLTAKRKIYHELTIFRFLTPSPMQIVVVSYNLVPRDSFPLTNGRKTRALGATTSGMRHGMP